MATLTIAELVEALKADKPTMVTVVTETEPKMRKTANPYFGRVKRMAARGGMVNVNYQNVVQNQRVREGDENDTVEGFIAEKLWNGKGEHVCKGIARHTVTGELYLIFYPTRTTSGGEPICNKDSWRLDGKEITDEKTIEDIKSFCPVSAQPKTQQTDKAIAWRTIKLDNVRQITMNGQVYDLTG